MKERPILMSAAMVRAILDGSKTQTRRVVRNPYTSGIHQSAIAPRVFDSPYHIGDQLWVRETWCECDGDKGRAVAFRADDWAECPSDDGKWRPSIYMPRRASRLTLEITGVRVERVQDITPEDCRSEGIACSGVPRTAWRNIFSRLWHDINAKRGYGWDVNPWVWVVEFKKV